MLDLHERLAAKPTSGLNAFRLTGRYVNYGRLLANFDAAYQRLLIPQQANKGAAQFIEMWQHSPPAAADATAKSVDYLAEELDQRLGKLPAEVLFLRGMAARARGDKRDQEKYFRQVWERGTYGVHLCSCGASFRTTRTAA